MSADLYRRLFRLACQRELGSVLSSTLELVLRETGAERGFLVTLNEQGGLDVRAAQNLDGDEVGASPELRPSRTVVREAIKRKRTYALGDDGAGRDAASVAALEIRSAVAVPIVVAAEVAAVVYVDSSRAGAFDAQTVRSLEALGVPLGDVVQNAAQLTSLRRQNRALAERLAGESPILGDSRPMRQVLLEAERVASTDVPVLVRGETGTGKELLAKYLHEQSPRRGKPFVAVNCAALPGELIESELFGHTAGAFTGATTKRAGRFAKADGGTLFLDEVGELSPGAQTRFLRVLETGEIQRVGDDRTHKVDVRIVAATHRDLLAPDSGFRSDLFYRLAVVTLELPPLRARGEDIALLAEAFVTESAARFGSAVRGLNAAALAALAGHAWPGNVRELRNAIQRATIFARGTLIGPADLGPAFSGGQVAPAAEVADGVPETLEDLQVAKREASLRVERGFAARFLERTRGNVAEAARLAGLSRPAFYDLLSRVELDPAEFRPS